MAYVNFGRKNTREEALASENKDKVFFPTDATSIILDGKEYGVGGNNKSIDLADYIEEDSTFKLDGSTFNYMGMPLESKIIQIGDSLVLIFRILKIVSDVEEDVDGFITYILDSEPDSDGLFSAHFDGLHNISGSDLSIINQFFNPVLEVTSSKLHVRKRGEWVEIDESGLLTDYVKSETIFEDAIPEGYVDLGLPSGKLWASCNLGASTETEYGDYYMWGSTTPNTDTPCDWVHAPFNNGANDFDETYFNAHKDEWLDGDVLKTEYDAVYQVTGGKAHIPTKEDFEELISNTTNIWTTINSINGYLFTSKANPRNKIFIPASGYRLASRFLDLGTGTHTWGASLNVSEPYGSWDLDFSEIGIGLGSSDRYCGCCIRGVYDPTSGGKKIKSELLNEYTKKEDLEAITIRLKAIEDALDAAINFNNVKY